MEGARWARLNGGSIQAGRVRGESHSVGRCGISGRRTDAAGGQLQECELPSLLNLEKESSERFKWAHLVQVQNCTDLPRQVTFPAHTDQGKRDQD